MLKSHLSLLNLLPQDALQRNRISSELADPLAQLVHRHRLLVEVESEQRLIVEIALLLNIQALRLIPNQLLRHLVLAVIQLLQKIRRNGQIIAPSQLSDLANVSEAGTHDDSLVAILLVVVEDGLHGLDTWILLLGVVLLRAGLVPVEDAADEGRDEEGAGFGGCDSLGDGEHEGQVAVDAVLGLQDVGGFDAFPGRGELDQDAGFVDADLFVEL